MSEEKLTNSEHHRHNEIEPSGSDVESRPKSHELSNQEPEQALIDIEAVSKRVEKEARSAKETRVEEKPPKEHRPLAISKRLKNEAYKKSLDTARKGLSRPERTFSRVVHQPVVDKISEAGAKTIARPSSLLTAGFVALIGSSLALFLAHRYGFRYNLLLFFALFVSGYFLGLVFEALRILVRGPRR